MDIRQSENYSKFMKSIGWFVEKVGETNVFVRKLGPTAVIKIQRLEDLDMSELKKIEKKYHPLLTKIEPGLPPKDAGLGQHDERNNSSFWGAKPRQTWRMRLQNLQTSGFILDNWPLLPTKTIILNLKSDFLNLSSLPKDTRYEIRKSEEKGLEIRETQNVELFYKLLQETMKIGGWSIPIKKEVTNLYKAFQPNNSTLLFAFHSHSGQHSQNVDTDPESRKKETTRSRVKPGMTNIPIAACLLIWEGDTAHYMYAALTKKGREMGAAYFLLWNTIEYCKKLGLKHLDLEGVYDERFPKQNPEWRGFTKFKSGWNGETVEYQGSFTKYANPLLRLFF